MNEKNIKNKQNDAKRSAEDIQLYRLYWIFGAAILGFAGLRLIPYATFFKVLKYGQWVALGLLVLVCAAYVYIRFVKKVDESGKVLTSTGVVYFLAPVLFMLACYRTFDNANFKFQVAFGFLALFAAIYNIFKKEFINISAITFVSLIALYYVSAPTYNWIETTIAVISTGVVFLLPLVVILALVWAGRSKHATKHHTVDKFSAMLTIFMCALILAAAVILLIAPSAFLYVMISLLVAYVLVGIVCTIRLLNFR